MDYFSVLFLVWGTGTQVVVLVVHTHCACVTGYLNRESYRTDFERVFKAGREVVTPLVSLSFMGHPSHSDIILWTYPLKKPGHFLKLGLPASDFVFRVFLCSSQCLQHSLAGWTNPPCTSHPATSAQCGSQGLVFPERSVLGIRRYEHWNVSRVPMSWLI